MRAAMLMTGVVALLLLSTTAYAQGKIPDACTLLTKGEIEQAFGVKLQNGKSDRQAVGGTVMSMCSYSGTDGAANIGIFLGQSPPDLQAQAKAEIAARGLKPRALPGVGVEAYVVDVEEMPTQLIAYRGQRDGLQISAKVGTDVKATHAGLEKIAKLVFERWK